MRAENESPYNTSKLMNYYQFIVKQDCVLNRSFSKEEQTPNISFAEVKQLARELIGMNSVTKSNEGDSLYSYTSRETITIETIESFLDYRYQNGEEIHPSLIIPYVIDLLENSGLVRVAVDENHFPQIEDTSVEIEIIQFTRFCLGVMYYESKPFISAKSIFDLINTNIDEFITIDNTLYEKPKIRISVAEKVFLLLNKL